VPGGAVTITYTKAGSLLAAASQVYIHIGYNGWQGVVTPEPAMTDGGTVWTYIYQPPAEATVVNFVFNNGSGQWDNNTGLDHNLEVTGGSPELPPAPAGVAATAIAYDRVNVSWNLVAGATSYQIFREASLVGSSATTSFSDTGLTASSTYSYTVKSVNATGPSSASSAAEVTTPAQPNVPDFSLTATAPSGYRLSNPGMNLFAAVRGTKLYVATWYAGSEAGNDHFIFVGNALRPSADVAALPGWNKVGHIALAADSPVLCMESSNGWAGWQRNDNSGAIDGTVKTVDASNIAGQNVEGVIDLVEVFGSMPETLYIASAAFQTPNQGILGAQAPDKQTDNGDLDPTEFLAIPVAAIRDSHGDGRFDRLDPARSLHVTRVEPAAGGLSLGLPTVPGLRYKVQYKAALTDATWSETGETVTGSGEDNQTLPADPPNGTTPTSKGFYRITVQP
jgi:hypothetical protein